LAPPAEVNVMAVVPPNLHGRRSIHVNTHPRTDQHVPVGGCIAAGQPILGQLEGDPARGDVVRLKRFQRGRCTGQDERRKRSVGVAAVSVGVLSEGLPHIRSEGIGSDSSRCRSVDGQANGVAAVERAVFNGQTVAHRQVDTRLVGGRSIAYIEEVDVLKNNRARSARPRENAMSITIHTNTSTRAAGQLEIPCDRQIGREIDRSGVRWWRVHRDDYRSTVEYEGWILIEGARPDAMLTRGNAADEA